MKGQFYYSYNINLTRIFYDVSGMYKEDSISGRTSFLWYVFFILHSDVVFYIFKKDQGFVSKNHVILKYE